MRVFDLFASLLLLRIGAVADTGSGVNTDPPDFKYTWIPCSQPIG